MKKATTLLLVSMFLVTTASASASASADYEKGSMMKANMEKGSMEDQQMLP